MANTATNVTLGTPKVTGAVFVGATTATLPTNATSELGDAFSPLGYVSEDGLTNNNTPSSDEIKDWGGNTVLTYQTKKMDEFSFTLIESMNVDVLKTVFGADNVSGTLSTGITIKANANELGEHAFVFDLALRGGGLKRIVVPCAKISEVGEINYNRSDAVGYELTLVAMPDSANNTHYEYIVRA